MLHDFVSMIFPRHCLMCLEALEKGEELICIHCKYNLPLTNYHLQFNDTLMNKFLGKVSIKYAWAYLKFTKQGKVQRALHKLKYEGQQEIGILFGQWYGADLKQASLNTEFELILPVPLHPSKLKSRGYNQSDTFAKGLSESMDLDWRNDILLKSTANETQTRKKRLQRWENVKDVYTITDHQAIINKRILLVDDVVTTGSTLEACARILIDNGCKDVSIAAIASA